MEKVHWKKNIDPNWIGCYVLPEGKDIVVKILSVTFDTALKVAGKAKKSHVAIFDKNPYFDKPMLLNATNCKRLTARTGSPYPQDWSNIEVTLCQEMDKCVTGGQDWGLRIKAEIPKLPDLQSGTKAYQNAVIHLKGEGKIEDIEKRFTLTPDIKKQLESDANT
ncbi:MAG: hypothetical protein V4549_18035 [Bacteroidota bacterium]